MEEVGGCDDREATAAAVAAWKQYLSGDTSVKSQPGRGATSAASGARLDSSRTAAHLAFSAAACAPSSTPNLPAVIAGFAANIATLLPMMNGLIASIQRVPPLRRSGRRSGRTFQSRRFSYPVTPCARCSRTRRRRGGNATEAHRASCKNPSGWRGGVVVCGFCAQQLAYKGKTMVSVLKHFLARPHMAHADNAADGRQRNMMRTQETLAACG